MRVLDSDPGHAKVLQQLGWLHHQQSDSFNSQELAIEYLEKSVGSGTTTPHHPAFSYPSSSHVLTPTRQFRCSKLVPPWPLLHVPAEIPQSVRSISASRLPRWTKSHFLVLHW